MSTLTIRTVPQVRSTGAEPKTSVLGRFFARLAHEYRVHRDLRRIESLDGRMLHDIGLTSGGLEDAVRHGRSNDAAFRPRSAQPRLPGSVHTEWR